MNLSILLQGFALSFSLFAAIGAQNVFVLKQGIMKNHILAVCLVCIACDVVLIALGVFGVAGIFSQNPYRLLALKSAFKTKALKSLNPDSRTTSLSSIILQTLAITLLNPHVYIDTIVVIGAYSLTLDSAQKIIFYVGAMSASLMWFASLGFFSHKARLWFQTPKTWAIVDFITALIMFGIAYGLWRFTLAQLSLI